MGFIMMLVIFMVSGVGAYSIAQSDRKQWESLTDEQRAKLIHDKEQKDLADSLKREAKSYEKPEAEKIDKNDLINVGVAALIIGLFLGG